MKFIGMMKIITGIKVIRGIWISEVYIIFNKVV